MWAIPVLRGWTTLLNHPHVCVPVHIPLLDALQSPFLHVECHTLRSVVEHLHTKKTQVRDFQLSEFEPATSGWLLCWWLVSDSWKPSEPYLDLCSRTVKRYQLPLLELPLCLLPWTWCTFICGRELFLQVRNSGSYQNLDCSTLMTLCGTHRCVQVGALAVVMVDHGSLPHWTRKWVMTLKWGGGLIKAYLMKLLVWNYSRYMSTDTEENAKVN